MTDDTLSRLVRWYAVTWMEEADGIDRLHDPHPGPSDLTGAPEWSARFRAYITDASDSLDDGGNYRKPMHAALYNVRRSNPLNYTLLTRLRETWDPELAAWRSGIAPDKAVVTMLGALRALRRTYQIRAY